MLENLIWCFSFCTNFGWIKNVHFSSHFLLSKIEQFVNQIRLNVFLAKAKNIQTMFHIQKFLYESVCNLGHLTINMQEWVVKFKEFKVLKF